MNRLTLLHRWLRDHQAYFWSLLALFPSLWASSPEIQALLPAKLVSWGTAAAAVVGFLVRLHASLKAVRPDPTDQAGA